MANQAIYPYGQGGELPEGYPIVNDLTTGGADKALSAEMGKELNRKGMMYIDFNISRFARMRKYINNISPYAWITTGNYACKLIPVSSGETYKITAGTNGSRMAVLTSNSTSGNASFATGYSAPVVIDANAVLEFTVPSNGTYLYVAVYSTQDLTPAKIEKLVPSSYEDYTKEVELDDTMAQKLFITMPAGTWVNGNSGYKSILVPVAEGETYKLTANANYRSYYAVLDDGNTFVNNSSVSYATGWGDTGKADANTSDYITIPQDGVYLYVNICYGDSEPYTDNKPRLWRLYDSAADMIDALNVKDEPHVPSLLKVGEATNIIYTIDDFLMAHEGYDDNNGGTLKFSLDLGKTWHSLANTFGNITNAFMFAEGTLMFCTKEADGCHAYWIRDFENMTVNETTILDYDGSQLALNPNQTRLYNVGRVTHHEYVDGVEHFCFGDYTITTGNPRLWYSCDNGRTIRCAFAFGLSQINGNVVPARHIHWFCYNKYDGYFYALTGDHEVSGVSECHIMRGRHDANHVWTWELLKSGQAYKLVAPAFDEGNMYCVTDYTDASLVNAKGIVSLPIDSLDASDMKYLFHATKAFMKEGSYYANPSDAQVAAIASYFCDNRGWRIAGTDYLGGSKLMIARGGHNFVWVDNDQGLKFGNWMGPNNNGDCYATYTIPNPNSASGEAWLRISHRQSYNVTDMFRNSGMTDFFEGWSGEVY